MSSADPTSPAEEGGEPVRDGDRAGTAGQGDVEYRCDLCGAPMEEWHCRIICTFCGYQRDCSDP
jgi:hypothetical protein